MQALAALYSSASAAPGAASASAPVSGYAAGTDGAAVVTDTLSKTRAAIGRELAGVVNVQGLVQAMCLLVWVLRKPRS